MIVITCAAGKSMWSVVTVMAISRVVSVWEVYLVLAAVDVLPN